MIVTAQWDDTIRIHGQGRSCAAPGHVWLGWKDQAAELLQALKKLVNMQKSHEEWPEVKQAEALIARSEGNQVLGG